MAGQEHPSKNLQHKDYAIAGAASGCITRSLFQPFDVLKIRFQLQIEPVNVLSHHSKYKGITQAMKSIYKEEGIAAFWKGHVSAQHLSVTYGALQFLSFETLTKQAWNALPLNAQTKTFKPVVNFSCGALSGCIATVGSFPFDVIRTRLIGQGEPKIYKGVLQAMRLMMTNEGPRSFYKGLLPALIQIAPNAGAQFAFYKLFKELWTWGFENVPYATGAMQSSFCGAAAGMTAKITVYPLDLIKKRIQVQGFEKARKAFGAVRRYNGFIHCAKTILKEEKFFGLYKGLSPSVYKAALTTGSHFFFYEEICKMLTQVDR